MIYRYPNLLLLLLLLPLILFFFYRLHLFRKQQLDHYSEQRIQNLLIEARRPEIFWLKTILVAITWTATIFALAIPQVNVHDMDQGKTKTIIPPTQQIVFLIDASASMSVNDTKNGLSPLNNAKEIVDQVIDQLSGEEIALFAFTSATIQLTPLSTDYFTSRLMLRQLNINEEETSGTDITQAIKQVAGGTLSLYNAPKTLIILTDGGDPGETQAEELIKPLKEIKGVQTFFVGLGSLQGGTIPNLIYQGHTVEVKLNLTLLQHASKLITGALFNAEQLSNNEIANQILAHLHTQKLEISRNHYLQSYQRLIYDDDSSTPLAIAILSLALFLILPDTKKKIPSHLIVSLIFPFLCSTSPLLWFEAGDDAKALNEYETLLNTPLSDWEKATIHYNIGTILLKQQKTEEAIREFEIASGVPSLSPLLLQRIALNNAAGELAIAQQDPTSRNIKTAFDATAISTQANCALDSAEGAETCMESDEIKSLKEQLQKLIQEHPLSTSDVSDLFLAALMNNQVTPAMLDELESRSQTNAQAVKYIRIAKKTISDAATTRMWLEMALYTMNTKQKESNLRDTLLNLIETQTLALQLTRLEQERVTQPETTLPSDIQKEAITIANLFARKASAQQKETFSSNQNQGPAWNEIIPLFTSAQQAATHAQQMIDHHDWTEVIPRQIEALRKWKETLSKLDEPHQPQTSSNQASFSSISKTLQEMEEEDRSHPSLIISGSQANEGKPW